MSLEKLQIRSQRPIHPTPAGLTTTLDRDGNPNIITLGEIYNLSIRKPVIVGLGIVRKQGHEPSPEELCQNDPGLLEKLQKRIGALKATNWLGKSFNNNNNDHEGK